MTDLFRDMDNDDDWIYVDTAPEVGGLFVKTAPDGAYLTSAKVNELHAALGRWLSESGITARLATAPPVAPESPIRGWVRTLVEAEVARVLPFHLAPQAAVEVSEEARCSPCLAGNHPHVMRPCAVAGCHCGSGSYTVLGPSVRELEPLCSRVCPSGAHVASRCTWCGHLWFEHLSNSPAEPEPQHTGPNAAAADREYGRLMSELPRRVPGANCTCTHSPERHGNPEGCTYKATWMHAPCLCRWRGSQ